jgi:parvulin-like peptidyl-prolyl isomerase
MLQHEYPLQREQDVARIFGQRFAAALFELEPGEWHGPIPSGYGLHLAYVAGVEEPRVPGLDLVRPEVLRDYGTALREQANEALLASVRSRYTVEIDEAAIRALALGGDSTAAGS